MPKVVKALCDSLSLAVRPISANASFFFFMYALETLVAFLQAYVFTILSSSYIGMAIHPH